MKGTVQSKKGYLYAVINYKDEAGKTKYKWIATGLKERGNRKAAKEILEREIAKFEQEQQEKKDKINRRANPNDVDLSERTMLFSDYCEKYVDSLENKISPLTFYNYKVHYMRLFHEYFDKRKLRLIDITATEIKEFYEYNINRGVGSASLKHYNNVLRPALRIAYKKKLIPDNPFDFVEPIKKNKYIISYYDKNEMQKLLEVIKGHRLEIPFMLAAYYGFRRSEVLGLRWSAVDFEHKLISINHKLLVVDKKVYLTDELKTKTSNRTLPLIPVVEKALLKHKEKIEKNKKFYGNTYDKRYLDYVCVEENGKIVYPDFMTKEFSDLLKTNGLKHIRLHDLRHSCASNMLASGVQMKEIQEWLGHSNFSTTADVYSHLDFSAKVRAAQTISSVYDSNVKPKEETIPQESMDVFLKSINEMKELGFEKIEDYIAYKEGESLKEMRKRNIQM